MCGFTLFVVTLVIYRYYGMMTQSIAYSFGLPILHAHSDFFLAIKMLPFYTCEIFLSMWVCINLTAFLLACMSDEPLSFV